MCSVFGKDIVEMKIIPHLSITKTRVSFNGFFSEIVKATLYKLKIGVQWHQLPTQIFFKEKTLSWELVFIITTENEVLMTFMLSK